ARDPSRGAGRGASACRRASGAMTEPARRLTAVLVGLMALALLVVAVALMVGSAPISARAVVGALAGRGGDVERLVVLDLRLPRIAAARLAGVVHWMLGNLRAISPGALAVFGGLLALGVWLILGRARQLNLLALGEEAAQQLGVEAERLKRRVFVGACLLTATVVAFAGPIGFVGLIVPHAVRLLLGPDNRLLVPAALLAGATFLLLADTLARGAIAPGELSVGVITSVCGAPFFVYLLRARHRGGSLL